MILKHKQDACAIAILRQTGSSIPAVWGAHCAQLIQKRRQYAVTMDLHIYIIKTILNPNYDYTSPLERHFLVV